MGKATTNTAQKNKEILNGKRMERFFAKIKEISKIRWFIDVGA